MKLSSALWAFGLPVLAMAQEKPDSVYTLLLEAQVNALRATQITPTTYRNLDSAELRRFDSGKDLPFVLMQTPNMVVTSDAGAGIGYTGMRIRGSDATRINVTFNGIPMNDAESQGVFWVNTPDLVSDLQSVQIQRGVGVSTQGGGNFGASVHLNALGIKREPYLAYRLALGSFGSRRQTAQLGTYLPASKLGIEIRLSEIASNGYIERASSAMQGYSFKVGKQFEKSHLQFIAFGGRERTYQAWYGLDSATYFTQRRFNYAGALYNENGEVVDFYSGETDNYRQHHYQLHYARQLTQRLSLQAALHYTRGVGYYEQYREGADMAEHGLNRVEVGGDTLFQTDLIRRLWLDNHFYGSTFQMLYKTQKGSWQLGGGLHRYEGEHYGDLIWARWAGTSEAFDRFYENQSLKTDGNLFLRWENEWGAHWRTYADVQYRFVNYSGKGMDQGMLPVDFKDVLHFFNPKAGILYSLNDNTRFYASYAVAHREASRTDYLFGDPKPERLKNLEMGWNQTTKRHSIQVNAFHMDYDNQLVLTGEIDNVGAFIRRNVGRSYRSGVEAEVSMAFYRYFKASANLSWSRNRNLDFREESQAGPLFLGQTPIAFSPDWVGGVLLEYQRQGFYLSNSMRYVGSQYLSNSGKSRHRLPAYFLSDWRVAYKWENAFTKQTLFTIDLFNVFDALYASNGYVWEGAPFFYAQAGFNWMAGVQFSW